MNSSTHIFFTLCISTLLATVHATSICAQRVLSIEECHQMAIDNNLEIKAAAQQTQGAQQTQRSYKANYFPTVEVNVIGAITTMGADEEVAIGEQNLPVIKGDPANGYAAQTVNLADKADFAQKFAGSWAYFPGFSMPLDIDAGPVLVAGVSVKQPIYMGGKIANASKIAQLSVEASEQNETLTKVSVMEQTDKAFALVVKAKEMQKVAVLYNQVLLELLDNVNKAKNQGMKTGNDVLKVQVKLNESELQMQKAANAIVLVKMNLCHIIGLPLDSDIDVTDQYPDLQVVECSIDQRPEAIMLAKKVEIADAKSKVERADMLPNVAAALSYDYVRAIEINDDPVFNGGDFTALLTVKIPIFNFGKSGGKVKAAKCQAQQARYEQLDLTEKMQLQQQQALNALAEAQKELEVASRALDQAAENMRASKSMYANGYETLTDHLESQVLWQKAMATKVQANFDLYLAKVELNKAYGTLVH